MTAKEYVIWLDKYLKRIKGESNGLSANQVKTIKRNLSKVRNDISGNLSAAEKPQPVRRSR